MNYPRFTETKFNFHSLSLLINEMAKSQAKNNDFKN